MNRKLVSAICLAAAATVALAASDGKGLHVVTAAEQPSEAAPRISSRARPGSSAAFGERPRRG